MGDGISSCDDSCCAGTCSVTFACCCCCCCDCCGVCCSGGGGDGCGSDGRRSKCGSRGSSADKRRELAIGIAVANGGVGLTLVIRPLGVVGICAGADAIVTLDKGKCSECICMYFSRRLCCDSRNQSARCANTIGDSVLYTARGLGDGRGQVSSHSVLAPGPRQLQRRDRVTYLCRRLSRRRAWQAPLMHCARGLNGRGQRGDINGC